MTYAKLEEGKKLVQAIEKIENAISNCNYDAKTEAYVQFNMTQSTYLPPILAVQLVFVVKKLLNTEQERLKNELKML